MTTILELLLGYLLGLLADPVLLLAGAVVAFVVLSGLAARALEVVERGDLRLGRRPGPSVTRAPAVRR